MNRRNFLSAGSVLGLSLLLPRGAGAQAAQRYTGKVLLHFHANGGWDPTLFCDAKLASTVAATPLGQDGYTAVTDINGIKVPAMGNGRFNLGGEYAWNPEAFVNDTPIETPERFFRSPEGQRFLVLNGVDTRTNSHETGQQFLGCGNLAAEFPALAALHAAAVTDTLDLPMAFLAGGTYNQTLDVIAASRFDRDRLANIAFPYRPESGNANSRWMNPKVQEALLAAQSARLNALVQGSSLPRTKRSLATFKEARDGNSGLELLQDVLQAANLPFADIQGILPYQMDPGLAYMSANNRWTNFTRPIESLLRCFQAGVSASATYAVGRGFDTHDNHDANQSASLAWQLLALRYTMARAAALGLTERLVVLVTSDFGRTPMYNNNNKGKDHWNVTSVLVAGPGITGGRAVGGTDAGHKPMKVDVTNVNNVLPDSSGNGVRIRPSHVHRELRRVLGIDEAAVAKKFPLASGDGEQPLRLLG